MWFSPLRRAHSFYECVRGSRIEGGSFSTCGSRVSASHTRFYNFQKFHRFPWSGSQKRCCGRIQDDEGAKATLVRCVGVPGMVLWH
eukprot:3277600-Pyramimonas_sp.AAC.1